jgi:hypothetical protein
MDSQYDRDLWAAAERWAWEREADGPNADEKGEAAEDADGALDELEDEARVRDEDDDPGFALGGAA